MFLEVKYDHGKSICSALELSFNSATANKINLICQTGDRVAVSFSFLSFFSNLFKSIIKNENYYEGDELHIIVPMKKVTIHNLLSFLCRGKLVSNSLKDLQDVVEAANILEIESQAWSIDIEKGSVFSSKFDHTKHEILERKITNSLSMDKVQFKNLDWEDCNIEAGGGKLDRGISYTNNNTTACENSILGSSLKNAMEATRGDRSIDCNGNQYIFCPDCRCKFSLPGKLLSHYVEQHTGKNSFKCGKCGKRFKSRHGLQFHALNSHEESIDIKETCDVCKIVFVGTGDTEDEQVFSAVVRKKIHEEMYHGDAKVIWVCKICSSKYNGQSMLDNHMREEHQSNMPDVLKCSKPGCGKQFKYKSSRVKHEKRHFDAPLKLECSKSGCGKVFTHKESRILHEKSHDPENFNFPCNMCDKKYMQKSTLLVHQETHKPWRKCNTCGKISKSKQKYDVHVQRCTSKFKYQCDKCDKKFTRNSRLKRHMVGHSGKKPFSCEPCGRSFAVKEYLSSHTKTVMCKKNRKITSVSKVEK